MMVCFTCITPTLRVFSPLTSRCLNIYQHRYRKSKPTESGLALLGCLSPWKESTDLRVWGQKLKITFVCHETAENCYPHDAFARFGPFSWSCWLIWIWLCQVLLLLFVNKFELYVWSRCLSKVTKHIQFLDFRTKQYINNYFSGLW